LLRDGSAREIGSRAEELLAVNAAEQEDESLQIIAQLVKSVGGVAGELCQRGTEATGVSIQPLGAPRLTELPSLTDP
jgi:hypothetical protein